GLAAHAATDAEACVKRKLPWPARCPSINGIVVAKHARFFAGRTVGKTYPSPMPLLSSPWAAARDFSSTANQAPAAKTHPATERDGSVVHNRVPGAGPYRRDGALALPLACDFSS